MKDDTSSVKRLFIAEDSMFSIRDLKKKLRHWDVDHEIVIAHDGQEAIEMLDPAAATQSFKRPDILLLDLNMPRVPGLEVLSFVRSQSCYAALPVAVLTTSDSPYDMDLAFSLNVDEYVIKDAPADELCAVLDRLLDLEGMDDFDADENYDQYSLEGDYDDDRLHEITHR